VSVPKHDGVAPVTPPIPAIPAIPAPDVAMIPWPADEAVRRRLAAEGRPRLLVVDLGLDPPLPLDHLEDWVRASSAEHEVVTRLAALARRARDVVVPRPPVVVDDDGALLRRGDRWVALPPLESRVFALLSAGRGTIVGRDELTRVGWPDGPPADPRAVDGVVKRLRRRLRPLGVEIHTATGRGFLLEAPTSGEAP
jgi:DNA-binding winged helix-turn-helix (wHTH) protein